MTDRLDECVVHYNEERPHRGLDNGIPVESEPAPEITRFSSDEIVCHERLGGLLKHYERRAA